MNDCGKKFQDLENSTFDDVQAAISRNNPEELPLVSVTVALSSDDPLLAQNVCIALSRHEHYLTRGNAVMSLGYLARRFRKLDEHAVKPVIEAALNDPQEYVRVRAKSAADEIHQFLHWDISGHVYG